MRFVVLGAAAGGGLPQWNCGCENCGLARSGQLAHAGQSSLAATVDGRHWAILNASPDLRQQMQACPALHPTGLRDSPLRSVLLTNGDIDHVAGLLSLREQTPFELFATTDILAVLAENRIFDAVSDRVVPRRPVALDSAFELLPGLVCTLFAVPGKVPLYMEGEVVRTDLVGGQTVGVALSDGRTHALYIPGCAALPDDLRARMAQADLVFFDGTLWDDDEMIRTGTGVKTGRRMGHVPISGEDGSLAMLSDLTATRVYIHINNTNPIWRPDSTERDAVTAAGWHVAADGQEYAT